MHTSRFGSTSPAVHFCLSTAFAILSVSALSPFSGAIHDRAHGPVGLTRRYGFCEKGKMKSTFYFTEGLVADFAARERVPLLDEPVM